MNIWNEIAQIRPPIDKIVIGIRLWPMSDDAGVICGVLYDVNDKALIDRQRGRWMEISHWAYQPGDEP